MRTTSFKMCTSIIELKKARQDRTLKGNIRDYPSTIFSILVPKNMVSTDYLFTINASKQKW